MSVSSLRAVSINTGTDCTAWIRLHTSSPSNPGNMTSSTTRSGGEAVAAATADGPSTAVSTWNSSARSRVATAARMVGSSSTTRILFTYVTVGAGCGASGQRL